MGKTASAADQHIASVATGLSSPGRRFRRGHADDSPLSPVRRRTVREHVYGELRRALGSGLFEAGEVLRIQEVSRALATSDMPVREALARLVSEQALEVMANRSVRVPPLTLERIGDLADARALIEGEATALAARAVNDALIESLRGLTRGYDAAMLEGEQPNSRAAAELNYRFHRTIYEAAGSCVLLPIIDNLWLQSGPVIRASTNIFVGHEGLTATRHHWAIVEALERRDGDAARAALRADIMRAFDILRDGFAAHGIGR